MASSEPSGIFLARPEAVGDGTRLAVKDLFDTAGLTTTYGSIVYAEHVPEQTAEAVSRLEAAGYANVGKTNLHEFAYGITSVNPHYGTVPNPAYPGRMAGGSSGGSAAALAAGLADAALGSDSGGSIRIPAACCGIVGFKPSFGLVSLEGCFPLAPSFDHAGPDGAFGRRVQPSCCSALADGFEPVELESLEEVEVGIAWLEQADPLVHARVREAAALFPRSRELDFPLPGEISVVFMREVADVHRDLFAEFEDSYGENVRTKIERCLAGDRRGLRTRRAGASGVHGARPGRARRRRSLAHSDAWVRGASAAGGRSRDPRADDPPHHPVQRPRLAGSRASLRPCRGRAARLAADRRPAGLGCARPGGGGLLESALSLDRGTPE